MVTIAFVSRKVLRSDLFWVLVLSSESYEATFPISYFTPPRPNIGIVFFFSSKRKEKIKGGSHTHIPSILGWRAQSLIKKVNTRSFLCFMCVCGGKEGRGGGFQDDQ